MKVIKVEVFPVPGQSKLKARANLTVGSEGKEITIKGFRIHDDHIKEPWVGVPQEKYFKNGVAEYKETIWINQIGQSEIYQEIVSKYKTQILSKSYQG